MIDILDHWLLVDAKSGQSLEEQRQDNVEFQPRKRRADAEMNARTEGKIWRFGTLGLEDQRLGKFRGIEIGGGQNEADLIASLERDAVYLRGLPTFGKCGPARKSAASLQQSSQSISHPETVSPGLFHFPE